MENNIIKENQLEILQKSSPITVVENNKLPVLKNRAELLPTIIEKRNLALVEIREEFKKIKQHHSLVGILRFIKKVIVLLTKIVFGTFIASLRMISIALFSTVVILSTTILTKNIVNSLCGVKATRNDPEYSIYDVKDDENAKNKVEAPQEESPVEQSTYN